MTRRRHDGRRLDISLYMTYCPALNSCVIPTGTVSASVMRLCGLNGVYYQYYILYYSYNIPDGT